MALDTTIAGAASDSYATLAEATGYLALQPNRKHVRWDAMDNTTRESLMRLAALSMDGIARFHGLQWDLNQARQFPRNYQINPQTSNVYIHPNLKYAQIEMAIWLSDSPALIDAPDNVTAMTIGSFSVSLDGQASDAVPNTVMRWLSPFISRVGVPIHNTLVPFSPFSQTVP